MARGFTLIETVMVMVVIAILAVVMLMRWGASEKVKLDSAARKAAGDIRYAQKLSISTQKRAGVAFNASGYEVYAVINGPSPVLANSPGDPCATRPDGKFVVDFAAGRCPEFNGVTLSSPIDAIAFDSIGTLINATSGAELPTQTINVGSKTLTIEAGTGRVSYY